MLHGRVLLTVVMEFSSQLMGIIGWELLKARNLLLMFSTTLVVLWPSFDLCENCY